MRLFQSSGMGQGGFPFDADLQNTRPDRVVGLGAACSDSGTFARTKHWTKKRTFRLLSFSN
jgi:hypothetical protein